MKNRKRIAALLLCGVMLFLGVSCTVEETDVPEGMKIATATGADFRLYVPTVWNVNDDYGVSGAYFNMSKQSTVSMVRYEITEEMNQAMSEAQVSGGDRLDWFWETECKAIVEEIALGGSVTEVVEKSEAESSTEAGTESGTETETGTETGTESAETQEVSGGQSVVLDTLNARRHHLKATVGGETLHFVHVIAEKSGGFYVFSFTVVDELYLSLLPHVEIMLENIYFAEPYLPDDYIKDLDENAPAPEGMKLASNDDVAYRFYVPKECKVSREERIFSAYLESDRSCVSVVPYMPDVDRMSVGDFYGLCKDMMLTTAGKEGFEEISVIKDLDLGGRVATAYVYRYRVGGVDYQYMQVIAAYKSMLYSVTYTALPQHFDSHLEDVYRIIDAFEFR